MAVTPSEIAVHVGQRLRDARGDQWTVRELLPIASIAQEAQWFVVRLDVRRAAGGRNSVVMSTHEFAMLARGAAAGEAVPA
jgi:hypothetical protein